MRKKTSEGALLDAIRRKCLDCSGNMRREAQTCKLKECPLWPYRPFQGAYTTGDDITLKVIGRK